MAPRGIILLVVSVTALMAASAQAATSSLDLVLDDANHLWQLTGSVSGADNAGIASFVVDLLHIDSAHVVAPRGFDANTLRLKGFVTTSPTLLGDGTVYGYQNLSDPNTLLNGIGQTVGHIDVYPGSVSVGTPWEAPVELAWGSWHGDVQPALGTRQIIDVFTQSGSTQHEVAAGPPVPEPASIALLTAGATAIARRRRRRFSPSK